uniref:Uncharacterized protein n=1 Tax=Picea sitchensis TaxID=3332 RepID=B8LQL3_PICSI|nr:unknown [Picea sitchensis]
MYFRLSLFMLVYESIYSYLKRGKRRAHMTSALLEYLNASLYVSASNFLSNTSKYPSHLLLDLCAPTCLCAFVRISCIFEGMFICLYALLHEGMSIGLCALLLTYKGRHFQTKVRHPLIHLNAYAYVCIHTVCVLMQI